MKLATLIFLFFCAGISAQISVTQLSSPLLERISNNAVCEGFVNDSTYLYTFGGIDSTKIYSGIHLRSYRYNIESGVTERIGDLPDNLGKIAAGASRIGDIIYIIGGYHVFQNGSERSSARTHRYDIANNTYLPDGQDLPIATDDHVQAVWNDSLIYVITGWSNTRNIPNVQIYDPQSDSWQAGTAVPNINSYKSFGASGEIVNDTIFYFGGASSASGFNIQNQLRKGVINPLDPTDIEWSISTPDPTINGYRMGATKVNDRIYWIGGSTITYNFNGIAYNGSGGVPPSNRILFASQNNMEWTQQFANEIPMDLRGIANVSDSVKYILGGMNAMQSVTNNIYRIEFDGLSSTENVLQDLEFNFYPNPFDTVLNLNNESEIKGNLKLFDSQGKLVLSQDVDGRNIELSTESLLDGIYNVRVENNGKVYTTSVIKQRTN